MLAYVFLFHTLDGIYSHRMNRMKFGMVLGTWFMDLNATQVGEQGIPTSLPIPASIRPSIV